MSWSTVRFALLAVAGGLALSLLVSRIAVADAPSGRYTSSSGTVYDTKTKLTWEQTISAPASGWDAAKSYCANLQLNGAGWHLPSIGELQTIVDESREKPAIDTTFFPNTPQAVFWSSSIIKNDATMAWDVDFGTGTTGGYKMNLNGQVRCVR